MEVRRYFQILPENLDEDSVGLEVMVGLAEAGSATKKGVIHKFDENKIWIKFGEGKPKPFKYDPDDILLCVYQFEKGIEYRSKLPEEVEYEKQLAEERRKELLEKKESVKIEQAPVKKPRKTRSDKGKPRKRKPKTTS